MSNDDEEKGIVEKSSIIVQFVLDMQEDSKMLAEFNLNPDRVMNRAGIISQWHRDILKSRNMSKISQLLEDELSA